MVTPFTARFSANILVIGAFAAPTNLKVCVFAYNLRMKNGTKSNQIKYILPNFFFQLDIVNEKLNNLSTYD